MINPFEGEYDSLVRRLAYGGLEVSVGEWQGIQSPDSPMSSTIEIEDVTVNLRIPSSVEQWAEFVSPNLPWAEEHFGERVSGIPYNPPPSHVRWPFAQNDNSIHTGDDKKFSHTYPERIWPPRSIFGIRSNYGNLDDLVRLLRDRPGTRQAYLPIWYPEDLTLANEGQRVPCTLGYHFLLRDGKLKISYYIRSCDLYRHFRDDVYMAGRLCQWVADQIGVQPGRLVMHISSLHVFAAERERLMNDIGSKTRTFKAKPR